MIALMTTTTHTAYARNSRLVTAHSPISFSRRVVFRGFPVVLALPIGPSQPQSARCLGLLSPHDSLFPLPWTHHTHARPHTPSLLNSRPNPIYPTTMSPSALVCSTICRAASFSSPITGCRIYPLPFLSLSRAFWTPILFTSYNFCNCTSPSRPSLPLPSVLPCAVVTLAHSPLFFYLATF